MVDTAAGTGNGCLKESRMARLLEGLMRLRLRFASYEQIAAYHRNRGATVGVGCYLPYDIGSEPYLISFGDAVLVSVGVVFATHDGATWVISDRNPGANRFGRIHVGSRSFIGANSVLLPGTTLGERTVVGAGAVVKGTFPEGVVLAGVPARVIGPVADFERKVLAESLPLEMGDRASIRRQLELMLPDQAPRAAEPTPNG
jgi:acetyltransferase-like isoleucine patch superfamily enzyme